MKQPSDDLIIASAEAHDAKFGEIDGVWHIRSASGLADFSYGLFQSKAAAAFAYCEQHDVMPPPPEDPAEGVKLMAPTGPKLELADLWVRVALALALCAGITIASKAWLDRSNTAPWDLSFSDLGNLTR